MIGSGGMTIEDTIEKKYERGVGKRTGGVVYEGGGVVGAAWETGAAGVSCVKKSVSKQRLA